MIATAPRLTIKIYPITWLRFRPSKQIRRRYQLLDGAERGKLRLKGRQLIELLNAKDRDRIATKLAAAADGQADPEPVEVRPMRQGDKTLVLFLGRLDDPEDGALRGDIGTGNTRAEAGEGLTLHFIDRTEQKK